MQFHEPSAVHKTVRMMVGLTILAWATQTLLSQIGWGQERVASSKDWPAWPPESVAGERFVPGTGRFAAGVTLELRDEATIVGPEVRLKQISRWSDDDAGVFKSLADLVLVRFADKQAFKKITAADVRSMLRDAGVNLANINFRGSTVCTVARSDVRVDEKAALEAWVNQTTPDLAATVITTNAPVLIEPRNQARELGGSAVGSSAGAPDPAQSQVVANTQIALMASTPFESKTPAAEPPGSRASSERAPDVQQLKEILVTDLCQRVGIPVDSLQISFAPDSDRVVNLLSPQFKFKVDSSRSHALGNVAWSVTITPPTGASQRIMINAVARAWQDQLVVARPVSAGQTIRRDDLEVKRALVEMIQPEPMLLADQAVGQQAGRDLKPGQILTSRFVEPVPLVRTGQFVTVSIVCGHIKLQTVGRAMGNGTFGQTVRVKNEATKETFDVIVTGPQAGRVGAEEVKPEPRDATVLAE